MIEELKDYFLDKSISFYKEGTMRLRNIPYADDAIASSPFCIQNPQYWKGRWTDMFQNSNPIHIEIGMGKGRFILELAQKNPSINYIGIEKYTSVLLRAVQKLESVDNPPSNLQLLCIDAENLPEIFADDEVSRIYLNFSDPWPKKRHARRRLTSRNFLSIYSQILPENGIIEFKTDNKLLFDYSLSEIDAAHWKLNDCTYDLHHDSKLCYENIMTEYEEKFSSVGNTICKLICSRQ